MSTVIATTTAPATFEIRTTRYGEMETIEISETAVIAFPEGVPGFERHQRFALIEDQKLAPFSWLQSLHDPLVGFLVIEPGLLVADYAFDIADPDVELLELNDPSEARVLSILVVPEDVRAMTANLQAPLILNPEKRIAKQVILTDERFPLRYPVFGGPGTVERSPGRRRAC
ncbi:MAG: flagellar assembly protein FliW [Chloroflexota bacterium]